MEMLSQSPTQLTLAEANRLRGSGDIDAAWTLLETRALAHPEERELLSHLSLMLRDEGRHAAALAAAARMPRVEPADIARALRLEASIYRVMGAYPRVLETLLAASATIPPDDDLAVEIARAEQDLGRLDAAQQRLRGILRLTPDHLGARLALAEQHRMAGRFSHAFADLHQALRQHPGNLGLYLHILRLLVDMGAGSAEIVRREVEEIFGPRPEFVVARLVLLREAGHWHEALALAQTTTRSALLESDKPLHGGLWWERAILELQVGTADSIAECQACAPLGSAAARARVHLLRARLLDREMRIAEAIGEAEAALALEPCNMGALQELSRLQVMTLNVAAAQDQQQRLATLDIAARSLAGRPTGAANSFFGQIIAAFDSDHAALAALRDCRVLPLPARIEVLRRLVRTRPDHVPTALQMLLTLRLAGSFTMPEKEKSDGPAAIPRLIAQFWDDPEPPADLQHLRDSWTEHNPEYTLRLFNGETAAAYLADHYPDEILTAFQKAGEPTRRADIFRLAYLAREGGVWVDMDDRCLAPLASFIPPASRAVFWQDQWGALGNNFMAAAPALPLLHHALETAVRQTNERDPGFVWLSLGPGLLSRAFARSYAQSDQTPAQCAAWLSEFRILDRRSIGGKVGMHCRTSHKRSHHHWTTTTFSGPKQPAA